MKRLMIIAMILAFAVPALALDNPNLAIFLDTDANTGNAVVNQICPNPNDTFLVYVCFDQFGVGGGMLGAALKFGRTFGGFKLAQTNLLGGLDFGDVEAGGWAITAGANCVFPDANGVIVAASLQYLYLGVPGVIQILPHDVDGNVGADCQNLLDSWCIASTNSHGFDGNFGVCTTPPPGDCIPPTPVEDATWGSIKSLYR